MSCRKPRPTKRVINSGNGPRAWCSGCQDWKPAAQVPMGQEKRDSLGRITASYAPTAH